MTQPTAGLRLPALTDAVRSNDPDAILLDHRFDYLEQDDDKVIVHFSNRTSFEAPVLVGADGGASTVRNVVFGGQNASYTGHVALRALVPFTRVPRAIIEDPYVLYVGAGRSLIHYPLRREATMNLLGNAGAALRAPWPAPRTPWRPQHREGRRIQRPRPPVPAES